MNVVASHFFGSSIQVGPEYDRSLKPHPDSPLPFPSCLKLGILSSIWCFQCHFSNLLCKHSWQWYVPSDRPVLISRIFSSRVSLSIFQKCHLYVALHVSDVLEENNEDLQNAKKCMAISMIAAGNYQSLKQIVHRLLGFVLDAAPTLHWGDLLKITHSKDDASFTLE